jgi:hypothetical protein
VPDKIIVTASDDQVARIDELADRLRAAGMHVDLLLRPAGVITGSVPASQRAAIGEVPGVAAVENEGSVQLAPPDADVQ